jgi:polyribonucleotide nucleotidyltransferase
MVASTAAHELHADAFRQLYPAQYYAGFLSKHLRPDGRQLSESRPTTIGVDTIKSADSSALVKTGSTTVVAGIKLEVSRISYCAMRACPAEAEQCTHTLLWWTPEAHWAGG